MPPDIQFIGVSKSFFSSSPKSSRSWHRPKKAEPKQLFRQLSLSVYANETVVLTGPNGSGKTTLIRLIAGLITPDQGEIFIGGQTQRLFDRGKLGVLLSNSHLYSELSGYEILRYYGLLYRCANLEDRIEEMCQEWRLEGFLHEPARTYSNGMKCRLSLAKLMLPRPCLLLLDEPTVYLDADGQDLLLKHLAKKTATVIIATHQPEVFSAVTDRRYDIKELTFYGA